MSILIGKGVFKGILTNTEYRKKKQSLSSRGCTFKAANLFIDKPMTDRDRVDHRDVRVPAKA